MREAPYVSRIYTAGEELWTLWFRHLDALDQLCIK